MENPVNINTTMEGNYALGIDVVLSLLQTYIIYCKDYKKMDYGSTKAKVEEIVKNLDDAKLIVISTFLPKVAEVLNKEFQLCHFPEKLCKVMMKHFTKSGVEKYLEDETIRRAISDLRELNQKRDDAREAIYRYLLGGLVKHAASRFHDFFPEEFLRAMASDTDII